MTGVVTPRLAVPDRTEREDLAVFVARAVRLDPAVAVRLRGRAAMAAEGAASGAVGGDEPGAGEAGGARVEAWAATPFDALVTRAVHGTVEPADVTVAGSDLLAALSVVGGRSVDPGRPVDERWRGPLPGTARWRSVDEVPGEALDGLAERGVAAAREGDPSGRPSAALLDQVVLTVSDGQDEVRVPMRCVFALAGMGFLGGGAAAGAPVRVSTDGGWLRMDARGGAVVRRRRAQLPLAL